MSLNRLLVHEDQTYVQADMPKKKGKTQKKKMNNIFLKTLGVRHFSLHNRCELVHLQLVHEEPS